ncbi:hypothetical protein Tco_1011412, partial [Tanacetum coccineum]
AMAAPDSPAVTLLFIIYYLKIILTRPPSSDLSLLHSSTSIPFTESAAISIIPSLSTKFMAILHVLSTTLVHATSTPVISTTPSQTSLVGLSRIRHRSPVTSSTTTTHTPTTLAPTHADLLPIGKRFRDLVFDYEASVEDGKEADAEADSEANGEIGSEADVGIDVEDEAYTEDYDTDIRTDIATVVEAHAQIGVKAEAEKSDGNTIKIGVDVVHPKPVTLAVFPVSTIVVRLVEHGEVIQGLDDFVKTWLRGIVRDEKEARARIERQLGLVHEELESLRDSRIS